MPHQNPLKAILSSIVHHENRSSFHGNDAQPVSPTSSDDQDHQSTTEKSPLDKVIDHLKREEWTYTVIRDRELILTSVSSNNGSYRIAIHVDPAENILLVYLICPSKVPEAKRLKIADFITRANYGAMIGNFEMDFSDGDVRYKGAMEYADAELTDLMIERLIGKCASTMDRYYPGIMRVVYGDVEACDAVREIENPSQSGGDNGETATAVAQLLEALRVETSEDSSEPPIVEATPSPEN